MNDKYYDAFFDDKYNLHKAIYDHAVVAYGGRVYLEIDIVDGEEYIGDCFLGLTNSNSIACMYIEGKYNRDRVCIKEIWYNHPTTPELTGTWPSIEEWASSVILRSLKSDNTRYLRDVIAHTVRIANTNTTLYDVYKTVEEKIKRESIEQELETLNEHLETLKKDVRKLNSANLILYVACIVLGIYLL